MNSIRRLRRTLARQASSPGRAEPQARQPSRPGRGRLAARFSQSVAAGQDRPAAAPASSRRRTVTMPGLLPHTIELCARDRRNPAGFWVSRNGGRTARRSWCLSCCQHPGPALRSRDPVRW